MKNVTNKMIISKMEEMNINKDTVNGYDVFLAHEELLTEILKSGEINTKTAISRSINFNRNVTRQDKIIDIFTK